MLKIKDSVDLETLEHCYISDDEFDQLWSCKEVLFDKDTRVIYTNQFFNDLGDERLDNLYDLIKMDLVEKVSD
ncbi:MAG TPA: hypothetical protein GX708_05485 [Gallicola sp.]|nr:hypothetical protein [Gallicola sp.]